MTWVQQNYDRFLLALFAVLLLACSGLLFYNVHNFTSVFASIRGEVHQNDKVPKVDEEAVASDLKELSTPDAWAPRLINNRRLPVFDSVPYISKTTTAADGTQTQVLIDPLDGTKGQELHPPVPNAWLIDNKQDLLSPDVLTQDSDGDGFTTLDEYQWSTDPLDKNSHPPYYSKVVYKEFRPIPFRLKFEAKNGDTILINAQDIQDAPTYFVKVGQMIKDTKFKVVGFQPKSRTESNGMVRDVSEVTVENQETKEKVVLPKNEDVNSPTTFAVMNYALTNKPFAVKKDLEFSLTSDPAKYKCLALNDTEVTILKEDSGQKLVYKKGIPFPAPPRK